MTQKVVNFVGYSNSGKTTLIEKLIKILKCDGFSIAVIKDTHHDFDIDRPGKDTYRFREAGASQIVARSDQRWALLTETPEEKVSLTYLLSQLQSCDLVFVEGFKSETSAMLRLEVWRQENGFAPPLAEKDFSIEAVITDQKNSLNLNCPTLDINDPELIVSWILQYFQLKSI